MSTDTLFSELSYPSLATTAATAEEIERARVRGHAAGYAAGLRAAEVEAAAIAERARTEREALRGDAATALASALAALESAAARVAVVDTLVLAESDSALAAAAIELAEAILQRELADGDTSARVAIGRALTSVKLDAAGDPALGTTGAAGVLAVRLSPVDLAVITANSLAPVGLPLFADSSLERGDAIVDVPEGRVDARIASALQRARAEIGALA